MAACALIGATRTQCCELSSGRLLSHLCLAWENHRNGRAAARARTVVLAPGRTRGRLPAIRSQRATSSESSMEPALGEPAQDVEGKSCLKVARRTSTRGAADEDAPELHPGDLTAAPVETLPSARPRWPESLDGCRCHLVDLHGV